MSNVKSASFEALLTEWTEARERSEHWKAKELELRNRIFEKAFSDPVPGTNKIRLNHGMALVGDYRLNYTVDKPLMKELMREPVTAAIISDVVSFRPEVSGSKFRKLDVDSRRLIADMITEKPGTPGIEIKNAAKMRW